MSKVNTCAGISAFRQVGLLNDDFIVLTRQLTDAHCALLAGVIDNASAEAVLDALQLLNAKLSVVLAST